MVRGVVRRKKKRDKDGWIDGWMESVKEVEEEKTGTSTGKNVIERERVNIKKKKKDMVIDKQREGERERKVFQRRLKNQ